MAPFPFLKYLYLKPNKNQTKTMKTESIQNCPRFRINLTTWQIDTKQIQIKQLSKSRPTSCRCETDTTHGRINVSDDFIGHDPTWHQQIYDIRLKSYRTALEEFQPSWDGSVRRVRGQATAAEYVARDLDDLNGSYDTLVDALQRRLQQLCDLVQQDLDEFEVRNQLIYFEQKMTFHVRIYFIYFFGKTLSDY